MTGNSLATTNGAKPPIAVGNRGLQLNNLDDMWRFAQFALKSGLCPKDLNTAEKILIALQSGLECGLPPMATMKNTMVLGGRATFFGDAPLAIAQASGKLEDIIETVEGTGEAMVATCIVKRIGRPTPSKSTFSWQQAKRAGLTGSAMYTKWPDRMLKFRARTFALRDAVPEVLAGITTDQEAMEMEALESPAFVSGDKQAPTDLESLLETDAAGAVDEHEYSEATPEDEGLYSLANPAHCDADGVPLSV